MRSVPVLAAALLLATSGVLAQPMTTPGPVDQGCFSSFRVGYSNCSDAREDQAKPPAATGAAPTAQPKPQTDTAKKPPNGAPTEADVDAYLANHGKPTREAARALLDPTDENIAAMARSMRQQAAVAAYVSGRMTAMQQVDPGLVVLNPSFNSEDLPMLSGMRVVLHVAPNCTACDRAAIVIQRMVAESPILDARIVMHGVSDVRALTLELGRMGITLPAEMATPTMSRFAKRVPIAAVADVRFSKEIEINEFANTQEVRATLTALRRSSIETTKGKVGQK